MNAREDMIITDSASEFLFTYSGGVGADGILGVAGDGIW
jgi:hypothetical protein